MAEHEMELSAEREGMPAEYIIASTTDTQDAVNEAAGAVAEVEEEKQPEGQVEAKTEEVKEEPKEEPKSEKPKHQRGGVDERLKKAVRENRELAERLAVLEARFSEAPEPKEEVPVVQQPQPQPQAKAKPVSSDFKTYDEYAEALADWKFDQRLAEMEKQAAEQAAAEAQQRTVNTYQQRLAEAQDRYEDWNEVAERAGNMTIPPAASAAIFEVDNGPDIVYYLAKNPEVVRDLSNLGPVAATTKIGVLSAQLKQLEDNDPKTELGAQEQKGPDRKPVTSAKPPIKTLAGRAASAVPLDQMDYRDYRKMRDEQERKRWSNYR